METIDYASGTCLVENKTVTHSEACTYDCGKHCTGSSTYPCVQMWVKIQDTDMTSVIYEHEVHRSNSDWGCAYYKCQQDAGKTYVQIEAWMDDITVGNNYTCLYDVITGNAIFRNHDTYSGVLQSIIWPAVFMVLGVAGTVFFVCKLC